jgi:hypothetical protein
MAEHIFGLFNEGRLRCSYSVSVQEYAAGVMEVRSTVRPMLLWHEHIDDFRDDFVSARATLSRTLEDATRVLPGNTVPLPESYDGGLQAGLLAASKDSEQFYTIRIEAHLLTRFAAPTHRPPTEQPQERITFDQMLKAS